MKCFPCIDAGGYLAFGVKVKARNNLIHIGHDFNCPEGSSVHACADGEVLAIGELKDELSLNKTEPYIWLKLKDKHDHDFLAGYIHVKSNFKIGDKVNKGDIIGRVIEYWGWYNNKKTKMDHVHYMINTHADKLPSGFWGYRKETAGFVDPIQFHLNNL